jgi:hypothetical protein
VWNTHDSDPVERDELAKMVPGGAQWPGQVLPKSDDPAVFIGGDDTLGDTPVGNTGDDREAKQGATNRECR